jgi:hypothetical protein
MAVIMKNTIFWDMTPWRLLEAYQCFGGIYCLHLKGQNASQARKQASKQASKQANKQTNKQTNKEADMQAASCKLLLLCSGLPTQAYNHTGIPCYMRVQKIQFHFNVFNKLGLI